MDTLKNLRDEFAKVQKEADDLLNLAISEDRELTADEKAANDKRFARLEGIKAKVDAKLAFAKMKLDAGEATLPSEPAGKEEFHSISVGETKIDPAQFNKAVKEWALTGTMDRRFATITTATASSILLPKAVAPLLVTGAKNTFREIYDVWGMNVWDSGNDTSTINIPVLDPTAGGLVAQDASSETENAPGMTESIVSSVGTYQAGSVYFSGLQLAATSFDLLGQTVPHLRVNKELGLEAAIGAALVADSGPTTVYTATTSGFTYANLASLNNALPKRYQAFKVMLLSQAAFAACEGLVDEESRPVMTVDAQNSSLKKVLGTPVIRCDYLEGFGALKDVGCILSLSGFHFRDAGEIIARYDQVPAKPNQIGINLFGYHAYGWADSAVAMLKTPSA